MNYQGQVIKGIMAVKLSLPTIGRSKRDKTAEDTIASAKGIQADCLRVSKQIFGKDFWVSAQALTSQIRALYYKHTSPWDDKGWRIIAAENWTDFRGQYDILVERLELAVFKQLPLLSEHKLFQATQLGDLYNEKDYPSEEEIKLKWTPKLDVQTVAKPQDIGKDLRFRLAAGEISEIKKAASARFDKKVNAAMEYAWKLAFDAVTRVIDRLEAKNATPSAMLHETVISDALYIAKVLPGLNITRDPRMNDVATSINTKLNYDIEDLRKQPLTRNIALKHAQEIQAQIDNLGGSNVNSGVGQGSSKVQGEAEPRNKINSP